MFLLSGMNNQNQVGNGGMIAAALALADMYPELARLTVKGKSSALSMTICC